MRRNGFTLIELILYIALVSVVLLSLMTFSLRLAKARAKTRVIGEVEYAARVIQTRIGDAVRHAEGINTGSSVFGVDPGVLSLDMVDAGLDPTVFSLSSDDGVVQISESASLPVALIPASVSVSNFVFENLTSADDIGIIQVQFTIEAVNDSGDPIFDYAQTYQSTFRIPLDSN